MKRYKITQDDLTTHNGCKWVIGEWREASGDGDLCGPGWLHCYCHPLLAVLHNPIHAGYYPFRLWEVEVDGKRQLDGQMKEGWTRMRLVKELEVPNVTLVNCVAYAILCAMSSCKDKRWGEWAKAWLSKKDRSEESAREPAVSMLQEASKVARIAEGWIVTTEHELSTMRAASWAARAAAMIHSNIDCGVSAATECSGTAIYWATRTGHNVNLVTAAKRAVKIK